MAASAASSLVVHHERKHEFTHPSGGILNYTLDQSNDINGSAIVVMDIIHTYVPPSARGCGIAKILCDSAFEYAQEEGYTIKPSCSYVSDTYIPKYNPIKVQLP